MFVSLRDGLQLHVEDRGHGSQPPLLLLHGFSGSSRSWGEFLLDGLARRRRVLSVDLPGHGSSGSPREPGRYAFAAVVADLTDLLDALDLPTAVWIGYSMGGRLALGAALFAPDRVSGLILESASPGIETSDERRDRRLADDLLAAKLEEDGIKAFVDAWESLPIFATQAGLPASVLEEQRRLRLSNSPASLAACLRGLGTGMQPALWEGLSHVEAPVLLIAGERDRKFVELNRRMHEAIPDSELWIAPVAGHNVHLECPAGWLAAAESFL
jgi:2-succinyl-6-hydroxy-2,4-cyclohexadiene-1-carboxylate synthase